MGARHHVLHSRIPKHSIESLKSRPKRPNLAATAWIIVMKSVRGFASFGLLMAITYLFLFSLTAFVPPLKKQEGNPMLVLTSEPQENGRSVESQLQRAAPALWARNIARKNNDISGQQPLRVNVYAVDSGLP